ncbi:hypothetical protein LTR97_011504 [Elasticomyces elasticus]|uniref:Uncharacterized protein n=1 Tax=Elasticomyces elasticus TaxID=574655 RepID=A0AAN7VYY4_9PEZI|nr:hypothetical protein LTR97_011504 [Elasticomyces elasticus]
MATSVEFEHDVPMPYGYRSSVKHISWMREHSMTRLEQRHAVATALGHQQRMEHIVALLAEPQTQQDFASKIVKLQDSVQGLKGFFSDFLDPTLYTERQPYRGPDDTSIAIRECGPATQQVFRTPELVEQILEHLGLAEILSYDQVDRSARAILAQSTPLQSLLSLRAYADDSLLRLPFELYGDLRTASFYCRQGYDYDNGPNNAWGPGRTSSMVLLEAGFESTANRIHLPKIDVRCRNMLITQPPIKKMWVRLQCCRRASGLSDSQREHDLHSDTGITIGDLYDATKKAEEEHSLCHRASRMDHDAAGFVHSGVSFRAYVHHSMLPPVEPTFELHNRHMVDELDDDDQRQRDSLLAGRMHAYMMYKRKAFENDDPIMTLANFEKAGLMERWMEEHQASMAQARALRRANPEGSSLLQPLPEIDFSESLASAQSAWAGASQAQRQDRYPPGEE